MDGIQDVVYELEASKLILFTSTLTRAEIFQGDLQPEQKERFAALMQRRNLQEVIPDARVTAKAAEIREHYEGEGIKIRTPDAIHLATGIVYEADEIQTLDGAGRKGLLRFNGHTALAGIKIVLPSPRNRPPIH